VKKQTEFDILKVNRPSISPKRSPLGNSPPIKYRLDDERESKTVKFEIHTSDDYASIKHELEELRKENKKLKELVIEAVPLDWARTSVDRWESNECDYKWELKAMGILNDSFKRLRNEDPIVRKVTGYFNIGMYADGYPGELFMYAGKQGQETHGWLNAIGKALSMLLQYGVEPQKIYEEFKMDSFDPRGITNIKQAPICKSIIDMIMKYMEATFMPTAELSKTDDDYFIMVDSVTNSKD